MLNLLVYTNYCMQRVIFWLNLPFCVIAACLAFRFLRSYKMEGDILHKLQHVDWAGMLMFTGSLTSILLAISWVSPPSRYTIAIVLT
jgi:hypothetical protein